MAGQFAGKVALVTGAGSGIGRATALAFAREGARVVVADVSTEGSAETVRSIHDAGGEASFISCDVTRDDEIAAAVQTCGRLDYACNNAGVIGTPAPIPDYPDDAWDRVIATNLTGVWRCMKHEIPALLAQGGGAIVNIASIAGIVGFANSAAYVAAKHGVVGLTKVAALEYAQRGIRVNAVCPGFVATPMVAGIGITEGSASGAAVAARHPIGRLGTPEEIAAAVLWLCADAASFVTGSAMLVEGGYVAH